jgi:hypothetical protein
MNSRDTWIFSGERTAGRSVLMAVGEDLQLSEWLSTFITKQEYLKIQSIWQEYLPALKDHTSSLVHGSPFPWTICLLRDGESGF